MRKWDITQNMFIFATESITVYIIFSDKKNANIICWLIPTLRMPRIILEEF